MMLIVLQKRKEEGDVTTRCQLMVLQEGKEEKEKQENNDDGL